MERHPQHGHAGNAGRKATETLTRSEELLVRIRRIGREMEERVGQLLGKEHAMSQHMLSAQSSGAILSEPRRKEIFAALVDVQDRHIPVAESRIAVALRFGVSEKQVRQIEREGLDHGWPPLDDAEG